MLVLLTTVITACSSSDDSSSSNDGSLKSKIVGKWYVSKGTDSNSYEYKGNGTAEYINYYHGGKAIYQGQWKLLKDDILVEAYTEPGGKLDKDWEKHPDISNKVIYVDDKELHFASSDGTPDIYYKQN